MKGETVETLEQRLINENWQLTNFERLGLGIVDAVNAVDNGIDYHDVESLLDAGCSIETALKILR